MSITDPSRAPTPQRGPSTTPLPTFTRRLEILDILSGLGSGGRYHDLDTMLDGHSAWESPLDR